MSQMIIFSGTVIVGVVSIQIKNMLRRMAQVSGR